MVCLVSGATHGIGVVTATELARRGANVTLLCRDADLAERVASNITDETGHRVSVVRCDLGSLDSVRQALSLCAPFLCPRRKMFTISRAHSHASTNVKRRHEYFRGLSRPLPVPGVLVSFLELRFLRKMALLALGGRPLSLSKSPLKVKRDIFTRK